MRLLLALLLATLASLPEAHAQSAEDGELVFRKCMGCHQIGQGARNRTGPVLTGVVGRQAGTFDGFNYSEGLVQAGDEGLVWGNDTIFDWLADPTAFLRDRVGNNRLRSKMTFRLTDEQERQDVIAYLGTFSTAALDIKGVCVVNGSGQAHLFAVETREGARKLAELEPGQSLCSDPTTAADGIVSVYESMDALEGCSRIVPAGMSEDMVEYAEFDRCRWGSHG